MGSDEGALVAARQALVTAHEVGHTLGFGHNWAASMNDRASVMEYPTPRIQLTADEKIDLSDAYQTAVGAYDILAVRYAYTESLPTRSAPGSRRSSVTCARAACSTCRRPTRAGTATTTS